MPSFSPSSYWCSLNLSRNCPDGIFTGLQVANTRGVDMLGPTPAGCKFLFSIYCTRRSLALAYPAKPKWNYYDMQFFKSRTNDKLHSPSVRHVYVLLFNDIFLWTTAPKPLFGVCMALESFEPRKKTLTTFHYTGWLIRILIMVYYNPYITG